MDNIPSPIEKFPNLEYLFIKLREYKKQHFEIFKLIQGETNDNIYHLDMFLKPVLKRSLDLTEALIILVDKWHYTISGSLLRMQIDNLLRVNYIFQRKDNDKLLLQFFREDSFRKLKHIDGKRVTDKLLIEFAKNRYPWIEAVYEETSKFIHLSTKHFYATLVNIDKSTRTMTEHFSVGFDNWPEHSLKEMLSAYNHATDSLLNLMKDWLSFKNKKLNNK